MNICGYLVVRKPKENFDVDSKAPYFLNTKPPEINGKFYGGIDRVAWFELEEDYYSNTLPDNLLSIREELYKINQPNLDIKVLNNFSKAMDVLMYSNRKSDRYEIVVIHSNKLEKIKRVFDSECDVTWKGIDIYYSGYGSQINEGIFRDPQLFTSYISDLNDYGLFDIDYERVNEYSQYYNEVAKKGNLEPMGFLDDNLRDIIKIGVIS